MISFSFSGLFLYLVAAIYFASMLLVILLVPNYNYLFIRIYIRKERPVLDVGFFSPSFLFFSGNFFCTSIILIYDAQFDSLSIGN